MMGKVRRRIRPVSMTGKARRCVLMMGKVCRRKDAYQ